MADSEEGLEHGGGLAFAVDADAAAGEFDGEGRGVRAFFAALQNGLIGDEPIVSPAAFVGSLGVTPAADVGFVLVGDADGFPFERDVAFFGEMEKVFVAVVDVTAGVDGLEVSGGNGVAGFGVDGDAFDPVKGVLQDELIPELQDKLMRHVGVFWGSTDVEEKRAVGPETAFHLGRPFERPVEVVFPFQGILVFAVFNSEIVGWRGDYQVDGFVGDVLAHAGNAIAVVEGEVGLGGVEGCGHAEREAQMDTNEHEFFLNSRRLDWERCAVRLRL